MSSKPDPLLDLASRVAGGERVDWEAAAARHPELAGRIESLRAVAGLADGFARVLADEGVAEERRGAGDLRWGHLALVDRIAAGSYGEVWRAFDPVLQREVALKLRRDDVADAASARSFLHEARRLAKLRHPNILGVHGADIHDGRVGLWSELLEGRTLEETLSDGPGAGADRVVALGRDLARALDAVHRAGIVHGDVKASNVAIEPDGRAVLLDFGAGIDLAEGPGASSSYASPLSAAPERLEGGEPTTAADVWSLGVVLYRLASGGRYPFEAAGLDGLREVHRRRGDAGVSDGLPQLPGALRRLLDRMLAAAPAARPAAAEVADRLRWIAHAPLRRRRRVTVAVVIASLVVAVVATGVGYLRARAAADHAERAWRDAEEVSRFLGEVLGAPRLGVSGHNVTVVEVLEGAERRVDATLAEGSTARARILQMLGGTYRALGRYEDAEPVLEKAVRELELVYGPSHPRSVRATVQLADLYSETGRLDEADELLASAAARCEAVPQEHEVHIWLRVNQASVARERGEIGRAATLLEAARSVPAARGPDGDYGRQSAEVSLAGIWLRQGRFEEVVELLEPLAGELEATRGMRHGNTLVAWNNLAIALTQLNRREEARARYERMSEVAVEWLGADHSLAFAAKGNLASLTKELGRVEEAAATERELARIAAEAWGADHLMTLQVESNLALSLKQLGETGEAERRMEDLAARTAATLGPDHPLAFILAVNRAELRLDTGRPGEALAIAGEARPRMAAALGETHLFVLSADSVIGAARCALGDLEEGLALLRATIAAQHELGGPHDQQALLTRIRLGRALTAAGQGAAAREVLEETVRRCEASTVPEHHLAVDARAALESAR